MARSASTRSLAGVEDDVGALLEVAARTEDDVERSRLRDEAVCRSVGLADALAHRYDGRGMERDDLEQVARAALVAAVHRYRPERGGFVGFAVPSITGELKKHFRDFGWTVRPPRRLQERRAALLAAEATHGQRSGRVPSDHELAAELECSVAEIDEARRCASGYTPASLDAVTPTGSTVGDQLAHPRDSIAEFDLDAELGSLIARLSERERTVLKHRFVDEWTQSDIGVAIGVSQMQVSRILRRVLDELRSEMAVA